MRAFNRSPERIFQIVTDWIRPPRGNIYDRNGKQLTGYRFMYRLGKFFFYYSLSISFAQTKKIQNFTCQFIFISLELMIGFSIYIFVFWSISNGWS